MKMEHVPVPVGADHVDASAATILGGIAVAAVLVVVSAPRLFALLAAGAAGLAGGILFA